MRLFRYIRFGNWFSAVVLQWPCFLFYIILIGGTSVLSNIFYRTFLIILHAYLVIVIIHVSKSKIIKSVMYCIIYLIFGIDLTLSLMYGLNISPVTLTLLLESNGREISEFLSAITETSSFWTTIVLPNPRPVSLCC